uniref:Uncharacterized protein n=1 Tax=Arundo donax TaxID=35708 RepID=A0A0A8YQT8_ARUDO
MNPHFSFPILFLQLQKYFMHLHFKLKP